uniref:hypothetical protein n=3 Tax=Bacteroides TaxID=816 RepID=UPI0022E803FF
SNLRSVNLFSTLQTPQLSHSFALRNQGFFDYITQVSQVCISLASPPSERRNDAEYLRNCSYIMCCRYFICHLSATVSATVQLFTNQRIICVWLQVADVFIFFNFIEEDYASQNDAQNSIKMSQYQYIVIAHIQ